MIIKWLKALVFCMVLQIVASLGAIAYLEVHNNDMAREYSLLAEQNARAFTSASVLDLYNRIQQEMQYDRIATTKEITRAIELNNARNLLIQGN
ncbi:hypothetical protein [Pseudomonas petrae]|uniref:Methyl-accepting chemotaxis protein n=1 Tax=Pseudomonas petrae TaxID=2912190 RepID=A0ABS9I4H1_9PSED|nr:hypothetical protein [Pseudomonas petrae]MCF7533782.1 hypothetical protein [Pseudomonas petrae]MCF7538329.1 hypothetical protein [Pseudomonas petrae]MCF7542249.1 hypothetical protein [Pseudomonas petrae]MCF7555694.1 hypothetical protein [Pseudomonas petrae]